jgi:hypothetical protein
MATGVQESPPFEAGELEPLWGGLDIEVIGLSGEFSSGKTLFGMTICPEQTLLIDLEKSGGTYAGSLGIKTRVDFPVYLQQKHPNGYKSIDVFVAFTEYLKSIPSGEYRVIMIDPISDVEQGLVDWVKANPKHFGRTPNQYDKASGLLWADVKAHWKIVLAGIASLCETFVFTTHMRNVWKGSAPTGRREPKGKDTLEELASLFLIMDRRPDPKTGKPPAKPAAIVRKSRLVSMTMVDGEMDMVPTLPPRLPVATPKAIRDYIANPPDPNKLKKAETAPEQEMSEDDRLLIQREIALANADAEEARSSRLAAAEDAARRQREIRERASSAAESAAVAESPSAKTKQEAAKAQDAVKADSEPEPEPEPVAEVKADPEPELEPEPEPQVAETPSGSHMDPFFPQLSGQESRDELLEMVTDARAALKIPGSVWASILGKRKAATTEDLADDQLAQMYENMRKKIVSAAAKN